MEEPEREPRTYINISGKNREMLTLLRSRSSFSYSDTLDMPDDDLITTVVRRDTLYLRRHEYGLLDYSIKLDKSNFNVDVNVIAGDNIEVEDNVYNTVSKAVSLATVALSAFIKKVSIFDKLVKDHDWVLPYKYYLICIGPKTPMLDLGTYFVGKVQPLNPMGRYMNGIYNDSTVMMDCIEMVAFHDINGSMDEIKQITLTYGQQVILNGRGAVIYEITPKDADDFYRMCKDLYGKCRFMMEKAAGISHEYPEPAKSIFETIRQWIKLLWRTIQQD